MSVFRSMFWDCLIVDDTAFAPLWLLTVALLDGRLALECKALF